MSATIPTPPRKTNHIGLEVISYKGGKSTLCAGCGHNSISERIVECFYELGVEPYIGGQVLGHRLLLEIARVFSGAWRTASTACTGACRPSPPAPCWPTARCWALGVTGDGDTASIGIGQFMHLVRRNVPMIYVIENNGVYGLTKGQFSATADLGSTQKRRRGQRSAALRLLRPGACNGAPLSWPAPSAATRSSFRPSSRPPLRTTACR